jgi:arylsulfatase A-like enzyme
VGKSNYLVVLTADHGFMPAPEVSQAQGRAAGRQSGSQTLARVNDGLQKQFGSPKLALYFSASALVLDKKLIAQQGLAFDAVANAARALLLAEPGIAVAYTRAELAARSRMADPHFAQMTKSWNAELSGDVPYALKPYWMMTSSSITTHGSPHPYDTHVPILMYGPTWIKPARVDQRVEVVDIAPTLARLLGVAVPAASEGRALPLR